MIYCGITGHTGNLGKKFQKIANNFRFIKFRGDIRKKKDVEKWVKNNNFDLIIHFAAIVPISIVNKNYKLAKKDFCISQCIWVAQYYDPMNILDRFRKQ